MLEKFLRGGGVNVRGVFVLGGNCPGGICPGVIVRGVIVRGVIVLIPCNGDFSFLPVLPVSSVNDQSKLPKALLVGGQCSDKVTYCLKSFGFVKLTNYLMPPNIHFCLKI